MYNEEYLQQRNVRELRVLCKKLGIFVTLQMTKSELIDSLMEYKSTYYDRNKEENETSMSIRIKRIKEQNK